MRDRRYNSRDLSRNTGKMITVRLTRHANKQSQREFLAKAHTFTEITVVRYDELIRRGEVYETSFLPSSRRDKPGLCNLLELNCKGVGLKTLPRGMRSLIRMDCSDNYLRSIPNYLGKTLISLDCSWNEITSLPRFSNNMEKLDCSHNLLRSLDNDLVVKELYCQNNHIDLIPRFSGNKLYCQSNNLLLLPTITKRITELRTDFRDLGEGDQSLNYCILRCRNELDTIRY